MVTNKKPFYKKWWFILIAVICVIGIVSEVSDDENSEVKKEGTATKTPEVTEEVESKEITEKEVVKEEKTEEEEKKEVVEVVETVIDTSVFEYATNTEVTDAIDINQHVTVKVFVSEEADAGMAVMNVVNQSYDFIQQDDVKDAKTITIFVTQNDKKIVQYTVQKDKFEPNDSVPMSDLVLNASEIEFMSDEVKAFGEAMETW